MSNKNPADGNGRLDNNTATAEVEPVNTNGRDSKGRFTSGNKEGKGNPFAANVAKLRKAALAVVTPEAMESVFRVLLLRAQTGHLPSMKLLFAYTLGKPAGAVDPDDIEEDEEEPAPPPVSEAVEEGVEEDLEEIEEEAFEEPVPAEDDPVTDNEKPVVESLSDTISAIPLEVRQELANRFRAAPVPRPATEQTRKPSSSTRPEQPGEPVRRPAPSAETKTGGSGEQRDGRRGVPGSTGRRAENDPNQPNGPDDPKGKGSP
jgi:hypothetical protein